MKGTSHIWAWGLISVAVAGLILGLVLWMSQAKSWVSPSVPLHLASDTLQATSPWRSLHEEWMAPVFSPSSFATPPHSTRPWTTWNWDPCQTSPQSVMAHLSRISALGFGGLVIQPQTNQWSNPSGLGYYQQLAIIFEYAKQLSLELVLSIESLPHPTSLLDTIPSLSHLVFGEVHIKGGKAIEIPVPQPETPPVYELSKQYTSLPPLLYQADKLQLIHVLATKANQERRSYAGLNLTDQSSLRSDSVYLLDPYLDSTRQQITWQALPGDWLLIAIYQLPIGITQQHYLTKGSQPALNLFADTAVAQSLYHNLLKDLYYFFPAKPDALKGIRLGSKAIPAEAFYYEGILQDLTQTWGYDPTPFLPAMLVAGRNNPWFDRLNWMRKSAFVYGEQDTWIRMDYEEMLSRQFQQAYLETSDAILDSASLQLSSFLPHWDVDFLALGKAVDGVVASAHKNGSSAPALKMAISSNYLAGNPKSPLRMDLNGHPKLSVYSPQLIQLMTNRLYGNGINDIQYDGDDEAFASLSDNEWANLLAFQSRCQLAMQQGKPIVDVGIYYPFSGFPESWAMHEHDEWMFREEVPLLTGPVFQPFDNYVSTNHSQALHDPRVLWLRRVWPFIQQLEKRGLSWSWVNRQAIEEATYRQADQKIQLHQLDVSLLWVFQPPYTSKQAAFSLKKLDTSGATVIFCGDVNVHNIQFSPEETGPSLIPEQLLSLSKLFESLSLADFDQVLDNIATPQVVAFHKPYAFLGRNGRKLDSEEQLHFFHNQQAVDKKFILDIQPDWPYAYWLNPHNGDIHPATVAGPHSITGFLGSYDASILWIRQEPLAEELVAEPDLTRENPFSFRFIRKRRLNNWTWIIPQTEKIQPISLEDTTIFSWWDLTRQVGIPTDIQYIGSFELPDTSQDIAYVLDLGMVNGKVDLRLNTQNVGALYQHPYRIDVSDAVEPGLNILEMWVTASALPEDWQTLPVKERPILGLKGPVQFWEIMRTSPQDNPSQSEEAP